MRTAAIAAALLIATSCGGNGANKERDAAVGLQRELNEATSCHEIADIHEQAEDAAWAADDEQAGYMYASIADDAMSIAQQSGCLNLLKKDD